MKALGIIVNIFLPGIGTMIVGKVGEGLLQLIFVGVAWLLSITVVGVVIGGPLGFIVWIWALISTITYQEQIIYPAQS